MDNSAFRENLRAEFYFKFALKIVIHKQMKNITTWQDEKRLCTRNDLNLPIFEELVELYASNVVVLVIGRSRVTRVNEQKFDV